MSLNNNIIGKLNDFILGKIEIIDFMEIPDNFLHICIEDVKSIIKKRERDSHKGSYGKAGILSGSKGMAGAAVLNLNAALRSGAGLVKGFVPESIYNVVESMSIEAITHAYDENYISFEEIQNELLNVSDVVATGSGCTNLKTYKDILQFLIKRCQVPLIIDAEGINLLELDLLKAHSQPVVLTPHYGEMSRLIKKDVSFLRKNITEAARNFSSEYNVYVVLKGARTIIACPDDKIYINTIGNPGMATAGSGDVLTGIIASFIGQGFDMADSLKAAVFMHGLAGDIAAEKIGEYSVVAGDLIRCLPDAFMKIQYT